MTRIWRLTMSAVGKHKRLWEKFFLASCLLIVALASGRLEGAVPRRVMAFYYPWYGTADGPGGAGRVAHWGRIDAEKKDISESTHYPALGAYDSHDPNVIDQHCRWAKRAGIDTLIVSWWGHGSYCDRAMQTILDVCGRHGLTACIYYETVPSPQTAETAAQDILKVLRKYGEHPAYLKIMDRVVVFVYGRALQEIGLTGWFKALGIINSRKPAPVGLMAIGDQFSYGAARVFDGLHTYNTAGLLQGMTPDEVRKWAPGTYRAWVELADVAGRMGKISALTVIPGYDDTKIRKPGLAVKRFDGELYRAQWDAAIEADPHWVLITSFNEWHEGSEIEPSFEDKELYLDLTAHYTKIFKANPRAVRPSAPSYGGYPYSGPPAPPGGVSTAEKVALRRKYDGIRIAALSDVDSRAFWWLRDTLIRDVEILSWEQVAGGVDPARYQVLLYCGGEHYRRTVKRAGDVDDALAAYLKAGGSLAVLPALPWPFYYDQDGKAVSQAGRFGVTIRGGWERPQSDAKLTFIQKKRLLPHVPGEFAFPASGDLRWRAMFEDGQAKYTSLLQLRDGEEKYLGDAVAYAEPKEGGRIIYAWFGLLNGHYAEAVVHDVFDFLASRLGR
jgi:glycoprotein endo-alpha-1,2-mannosidase